MELKGKTAIVTGSGRGIGEGIALVLAREGASLVINDRKITQDAEGVVKKINAMGGKAIAVEADISNKSEVTAMAEQAVREFGAIDILVNNAGIESHPVLTMELAEESLGPSIERQPEGVIPLLSGGDSADDEAEQGPHHQHRLDGIHKNCLFRER